MSKPQPSKAKRQQVSINAFPRLHSALRAISKAYKAEEDKEALAIPYIITCAATLEARLNDELTRYVNSTWKTSQQSILSSYLSMSFRGKFETLPILLTKEKFQLNHDDVYIQRLHALITSRNLLVHPKPTSGEILVEDSTTSSFFPLLGPDYYALVEDYTFGAKHDYSPEDFHEALEKLDKWFFRRLPDHVSKVRLLRPRT